MISTHEASEFLSHQLKFKNWRDVLQKDKLKFLQLLVPHFAHHMYFQVKITHRSKLFTVNDVTFQFIRTFPCQL